MTTMKIVRGVPSGEELAALTVAILVARRRHGQPHPLTGETTWRISGGYAPPGSWTSRGHPQPSQRYEVDHGAHDRDPAQSRTAG